MELGSHSIEVLSLYVVLTAILCCSAIKRKICKLLLCGLGLVKRQAHAVTQFGSERKREGIPRRGNP
jgi:hypothetical protein